MASCVAALRTTLETISGTTPKSRFGLAGGVIVSGT
jgi:hypothetical protein